MMQCIPYSITSPFLLWLVFLFGRTDIFEWIEPSIGAAAAAIGMYVPANLQFLSIFNSNFRLYDDKELEK